MWLTGRLFDSDGHPISPTTAYGRDSKRLYRYYVSASLQRGEVVADPDELQRLPARSIHRLVMDRLGRTADVDDPIHAHLKRLHAHPDAPLAELRQAQAPANRYERGLTALAFLAPDIQAAILAGRQPPTLSMQQLVWSDLPLSWADQRRALGFPDQV